MNVYLWFVHTSMQKYIYCDPNITEADPDLLTELWREQRKIGRE